MRSQQSAGQTAQFNSLEDAQSLERMFQLSNEQPVILFKHSLTCPISSAAYQEMSQLASEVALIVVQRARDLSREVETRTGIRHESPQAIILRKGEVVWHASHWKITSDAVEQAVSANL